MGYGSAVTEADGTFALRALIPGAVVSVAARAEGYTPWNRQVKRGEQNADLELGDITLEPADRVVDGLVVDENGKPFAGVDVRHGAAAARTDRAGRFRLTGLPRGAVYLSLSAYADGERPYGHRQVKKGEDSVYAILLSRAKMVARSNRMPPIHVGAWVRGQAPEGGLAGKATLLYRVPAKRTPSHLGILRGLSRLAAKHAKPGVMFLCLYPADAQREAVAKETANLAPGLRVGIDQAALPGSGSGRTDAFFQAYNLQYVRLFLFDRAGRKIQAQRAEQNWKHVERSLAKQLDKALSAFDARVTVVGPNGEPAQGARLVPVCENAHTFVRSKPATDAKGFHEFKALPGPGPLRIMAFDIKRGQAAVGEAGGGKGAELTLKLAAQPAVTGRVVDRKGRPLPNAQAEIELGGQTRRRHRARFLFNERIDAGKDGKFAIAWIPPTCDVVLKASAEGYWREERRSIHVAEGTPRSFGDIQLYRANKTLALRVLDQDGKPRPGLQVGLRNVPGARTDAEGMAYLTGLPDKPVRAHIYGNKVSSAESLYFAPGKASVVLMDRSVARDIQRKMKQPGKGRFPWRVSQWVVGGAVDAKMLADRSALVVVAGEGVEDTMRQALLKASLDAAKQYAERGLAVVFVFPAGASAAEVKRLAAGRTDVHLGIDEPVGKKPGAPGYSAALWRAMGHGSMAAYISRPGAAFRRIHAYRMANETPEQRIRRAVSEIGKRLPRAMKQVRKHAVRGIAPLRKRGEIKWERPDPFDKDAVWVGLKDGIGRWDKKANTVKTHKSLLGLSGIKSVGVAFTAKSVFVGTNHGLLSYMRTTKAWNRVAPGGDYDLLETPITRISQKGDRIAVEVRAAGGKKATWVCEGGQWQR